MSSDSSVHVKKDTLGRIVEKWGNEKSWDDDGNFRYFYEYDDLGNLVKEKRFFLKDDNSDCIIIDSADYEEIFIYYQNKSEIKIKWKEEKYLPVSDENGKVISRELYYIYDCINQKFLYHKDDNLNNLPK